MEENKKRKQINFYIDIDLHTEIKIRAAKRNISMNMWIYRAIIETIKKEDKYK